MNKIKGFLRGLLLALVVAGGIAAWLVLPWYALLAIAVLFGAWMALTRRGRQAGSVTQVGLSTLGQRVGASSVVVVGIAGVVAVLVALLAMAEGYRDTLEKSGSDNTALVMRGASAAEVMSTLDNASINVISQAPGIARDADGKPLASAELLVAANLPLRGGAPDEEGSVQLRGVGPQAWAVRPNIQVIDGRKFEPGRRELVAGVGAQRQFAGLEPGNTLHIGSQDWTVVGVFRSGDALDSELWADAGVVASTYERGSTRSSVTAKLERASAFKGFKAALAAYPRLDVDTQTTLDYFSEQSKVMTMIIRVVGMVVGAIM